ncbi:uncharacterized protein EV420DRAFT_1747950 [Desarmillaria tabescens]|uniref:Uncharacterized protein n=1 Tax=Armillaria tabescens TaxID=1929756 RepID=A0AA39KEN8_ARMTA|nr:uncharacterized protein EV420DRAFT_1747950 [Desarmillaria tabescens]KAK0458409.1 hypothetical protein EV420DRAFT_1747950 [Desarmillaria tabescens]
MFVNHYPPTQCAAYVQKTPLTQCCTCETWLADHVAINNLFRHAEPWKVLDNFAGNNDTSHSLDVINFFNDAVNDTFTPSANSDTDTFYHDANPTPITAAPTFPLSAHHPSRPYNDVGNIPLAPSSPSPSASNTPSGIQSDDTQAQGYHSDHYFVRYPDHFMNNPYAHQPDGGATGGSFEHHYYSPNTMHGATPEAGSDSYI